MHRAVISGVLVAFVMLCASSVWAGQENRIQSIQVEEGPNNTVISIVGSKTPTFTVFKLLDPVRLLVDVADATMDKVAGSSSVRNGVVHDIETLTFRSHGRHIGRFIIGFDREAPYTVKADGNRIRVVVDGTDRALPRIGEERAKEALERVRKALAAEKELLKKLSDARERELRLSTSQGRLTKEKTRLQVSLQQAETEITRLRSVVASQLSEAEKNNALRKQAAAKAEQKKEALQEATRVTQLRLVALQAQKAKAQAENQALKKAIAIAEKRRASLQKALQLEESRRKVAIRSQRVKQELKTQAKLQREAEALRRSLLAKVKSAEQDRDKSMVAMRTETKRLKTELNVTEQRLADVKGELGRVRLQSKNAKQADRTTYQTLEKQLLAKEQRFNEQLKTLQLSKAKVEIQATKAQQSHEDTQVLLVQAEERLKTVNSQKTLAEKRHAEVAAQITALSNQLNGALKDVTAHEEARLNAEKTVEVLRSERIGLEQKVLGLQNRLDELKTNAARLASLKKALEQAALKNNGTQKAQLEKMLVSQRKEMQAIKLRLETVNNNRTQLERDLKGQQAKVQQVRGQLQREKTDLAAVLRQKEMFSKQAEELRLQNLSAQKNLRVVRGDLSDAEFELDRLVDQRESVRRQLQTLETRVKLLEGDVGNGNDRATLKRMLDKTEREVASLQQALKKAQIKESLSDPAADQRLEVALNKARKEAKKTREGRKKLKQLEKVLRAQRKTIKSLKSDNLGEQLAEREKELHQLRVALRWMEESNKNTLQMKKLSDRSLRKELKSERRVTRKLYRQLRKTRVDLKKSSRTLATVQRKLNTEVNQQRKTSEKRIASLQLKLTKASNDSAVSELKKELASARTALLVQKQRTQEILNRTNETNRQLLAEKEAVQLDLHVAKKVNDGLKAALSDVESRLAILAHKEDTTAGRVVAVEKRLASAQETGQETQGLKKDLAVARGELKRVAAEIRHEKRAKKPVPAVETAPLRLKKQAQARVSDKLVRVTNVTFGESNHVAYVDVELDGVPSYNLSDKKKNRLSLVLRKTRIPKVLERRLDTRDFYGPVQMVSSYSDPNNPDQVLLVVHLNSDVKNRVRRSGKSLRWEFVDSKLSGTPGKRALTGTEPVAVASSGKPVQYDPTMVGADRVETPPEGLVIPGGGMDFGVLNPVHRVRQRRRYKGPRISLSIKDADIQEVLAFLAEQGAVNIITGEEVSGTTTMHLKNVPWELALDLVLKSKGLDYVLESGVYRVAPIEAIQKEFEQRVEKRKKLAELKRLVVKLVTVNYATAKDLEDRVKDILSEKGSVSTDTRTNTLIVKDIEEHVVAAEDLVRRLDTQTPQVLIEARIVEAASNFSEELGIQWGGNYTASPAFGNETGLVFPGIIGISGAADDPQSPTGGLLSDSPNFAVNLPAAVGAGKGGGIGLTLGSVSGAASLALRLTAAEERGTVKIISSPRIATLDNTEATINQGISIPIAVVSSLGVNTQFFNAELNLKVKPHVTQDGNVNLKVDITKNEPNFSQRGANGNPTIEKKEAHTQLLVRDGDTAVIGGIYTRNTSRSYKKIPIFGDIPVIGWLFKSRVEADKRTELLLFITPRIINRSASRVRVD